MKSYLLVPKESIETHAQPGVRGTEQGERVLQRSTALQFMISGRAPDMLRSLGLHSATLPGRLPEISTPPRAASPGSSGAGRSSKASGKAAGKGSPKGARKGANEVQAAASDGPVMELASASDVGTYRHMPLIGATMAHFVSENAERIAREELGRDFEFIPDTVHLTFPGPVAAGQIGPRNRGLSSLVNREWPEESGVNAAHAQGIKGAGVMLGILDTGVDADHPEHQDRLIQFRYVSLFPNSPQNPARDVRGFDPDGHGTHVAGIAAGSFHGVAPEVDLYVASVIESENIRTSLGRVAAGMEWLLHQFSRPENSTRPAVVNMSLGFPAQPPTGVSDMEYRLNIRALQTLVRRLVDSNVLAVVAAGNGGAGTAGYPAAFPEALSVGAVDFSRRVASFSASGAINQRSVPDVMGYGVNVYSSTERRANNQAFYERMSGTSMAAPYVAGLAALYRCRSPDLTALEVRDLILDNALKLPKNPLGRVGRGLAVYK